jgi:threonine aldolase
MDFRSDNVARVAPEIFAALAAANEGTAASYGADRWTAAMVERFSELFERKVAVFPVSTGIAANGLSIAACTLPYGLVYCHPTAHIQHREGGAAEFYTAGAKLVPVDGADYRIDAKLLAERIASDTAGLTAKSPSCTLSLTNATDGGTVYTPAQVTELAGIAHKGGLKVHMDGARFANAVASLGCTAAELSWRAGVDILSFGATKCGAMSTDAIVVFDETLIRDLQFRLRRAGQIASKMRFASAQLERFVRDGLWLQLAKAANAAATRLSQGLARVPGIEITASVEANEVFARLPDRMIDALEKGGVLLYRRGSGNIRLVCRFDTTTDEVDGVVRIATAAGGTG